MSAKAHLKLKKVGGRWNFTYHTPESILPNTRSKEDLQALLDYHSNPFIKQHTHDSPEARRHYVEKIRPALRWFCKSYGVNTPSWLEGNMHYDELPPEEHEALFGKDPLEVREFTEQQTTPAPDHPAMKEG